jgi:hypothetical protein
MSVTDDYGLPDDSAPVTTTATTNESGSGLRKQLTDTLAANKAYQERITSLEAERRTDKLTGLAKDAGLSGDAATRYPADAEVTPEKFTAWLDEQKTFAQQLLGATTQPGAQTAAPATPTAPAGVTPADQLSAARVQAQADGASPPVDGLDGMLNRLADRNVPWPQLQQEMEAFGFKNP